MLDRPTFPMAALAVAACLTTPAAAQVSAQAQRAYDGVGLEQRLGDRIPLRLEFRNSEGRIVELDSFFGDDRPVLLTFVYHTCPMLCGVLLGGLTGALAELDWTPGLQFEAVAVSFHPGDTPESGAAQKARTLRQLGKPGAAWHFLTGDEETIRELARAVGFRYRWVEEQGEYAHPAALVFLAADGTITRYLADLAPRTRDMRAALVEASHGSVGSFLDRAFLYCFRFDPDRNSYVLSATVAMRIGGLVTVLLLFAGLCALWGREIRRKQGA